MGELVRRLILNIGAGPRGSGLLPPCFDANLWHEVRLDIDPGAAPDVVGSILDLRPHFGDAVFDALWSSHNMEHLYAHEIPVALDEFRRVLKPSGFAIVTCPDAQSVAEALIAHGIDWTAYEAPIGPVTVHDMIFGHGGSVARGNTFMAHRTAFTQDRLGRLAVAAGFRNVRVGRGDAYNLWAFLPMDKLDLGEVHDICHGQPLAFLFSDLG